MTPRDSVSPRRRWRWTAIALACSLTLPAAAEARRLGTLDFTPCTLEATGTDSVDAFCTTVRVPENRAEPDGRQIDLALAWVPSTAAQPEPDPVFLLAGGPGQGARQSYPQVAGAFRDVLRNRHVILLDQRGTGGSNPLSCRDPDGNNAFGDPEDDSPEAAARFAAACRDALSARADLRVYTSTDAVADLDTVRQRLGAERINLYGGSYGTRMGQLYAKTFPQHTRSLVLDSVVPMDLVLGSEHARNLEAALEATWQRCAADSACAKALPEPKAALARVREALESGTLTAVRYRDPTSGAWREDTPGWGHLAVLLRMYSYSPATAATLPLMLQQAAAGDWAPMLAQSRMLMGNLGGTIMHGMQLSVSCSEDVPDLREQPEDAGTVLGDQFVAFSRAQCAEWPRGERPADFRAPLTGDLPVLAISGELDPVTPPRYAEAVVTHLPNGRHLMLKGQGHTPLGVGCLPKLFAQFIERADARGLDASCLDRLAPLPPFVGAWGPEP
jgi:pimeloyl-ACP methyl ester carboxylesterase